MSFKTYAETGKYVSDFEENLNEGLEPQYLNVKTPGKEVIEYANKSKVQKEIKNYVKKLGFEPDDIIVATIWNENSYKDNELTVLRFNEYVGEQRFTFKCYIDSDLRAHVHMGTYSTTNQDLKKMKIFNDTMSRLIKLAEFLENYDFSKSDLVVLR